MKAVDILPGSCTKGLSENVVVRGGNYLLNVRNFIIRAIGRGLSLLTIIIITTTALYVLVKKVKKAFRGVYLLRIG